MLLDLSVPLPSHTITYCLSSAAVPHITLSLGGTTCGRTDTLSGTALADVPSMIPVEAALLWVLVE